jgi:hypothetical protein
LDKTSLETPWGPLKELNIADRDLCLEILSCDKHQLVEGLVVENIFDQIVGSLEKCMPGIHWLDIETAIVDTEQENIGRWHAFVWVRTRTAGLGRYLTALGKRFRTWVVETDTPLTDFFVREFRPGEGLGEPVRIADLMIRLSGRKGKSQTVNPDVRNFARQQQSFWGFLVGTYEDKLGERVVLPRIFLNQGIQRWFRRLWNLDRILVHEDRIWLLEIKHKYPYRRKNLSFGINRGELGVFDELSKCGIDCFHAILVKPHWHMHAGSSYLLNSLEQREHALLIGKVLDERVIRQISTGPRSSSPGYTSFDGNNRLDYFPVPANSFGELGMITDPRVVLAEKLATGLRGVDLPTLTDERLSGLRLKDERK